MMTMLATNVNIDELIEVLIKIREQGGDQEIDAVDIEITKDKNAPGHNKLTIYPVKMVGDDEFAEWEEDKKEPKKKTKKTSIDIKDPDVSTDNNDIFGLFNDLI